jgi:hypothetical protein
MQWPSHRLPQETRDRLPLEHGGLHEILSLQVPLIYLFSLHR